MAIARQENVSGNGSTPVKERRARLSHGQRFPQHQVDRAARASIDERSGRCQWIWEIELRRDLRFSPRFVEHGQLCSLTQTSPEAPRGFFISGRRRTSEIELEISFRGGVNGCRRALSPTRRGSVLTFTMKVLAFWDKYQVSTALSTILTGKGGKLGSPPPPERVLSNRFVLVWTAVAFTISMTRAALHRSRRRATSMTIDSSVADASESGFFPVSAASNSTSPSIN